jgi:NTE family protein
MKYNVVLEGGGVKGFALIGAISYMEGIGHEWNKIAGTSVGAIVGALLAAGYKSHELHEAMQDLDLKGIMDKGSEDKLFAIGPMLSILTQKGIYEGNFIEKFIDGKLAEKGVHSFGDLKGRTLKVIASDISRRKMIVLPDDLPDYGIEPESYSIAKAVRMSMSLPLFFEPVVLNCDGKPCYIIDGAVFSNFPMWLFNNPDDSTPTIGMKLIDDGDKSSYRDLKSTPQFIKTIIGCFMDSQEHQHIDDEYWKNVIAIPTLGVGIADFNLSFRSRWELWKSGYEVAKEFMEGQKNG